MRWLFQESWRWCWWTEKRASVRRLALFLGGLCTVFGGLEWVVQANSELLEALSDRGQIKVAMFAQRSRDQFLFLGSSRTEGGVSPVLITRALRNIAPALGDVHGFNAAVAGSDLNALSALVSRIGFTNNLRLVVVELSSVQLKIEPLPQEEPPLSAVTIEDRLAALTHHVHLIKHRKGYRNLGYLPAILILGPHLSGWETKAKDQIAAFRGVQEAEAVGFDERLWGPDIVFPSASPQPLDEQSEKIVARVVALAHDLQEHGVRVVFAVPPLRSDFAAPEKGLLRPLFAEVARRTHCEVWDFSSRSLPDIFFRDASHLGDVGRAHYSRALARPIVEAMKAK